MSDYTSQRFGDYLLVRFLGDGTFGDVYLAEHMHKKTSAAIKIFKTRLTLDKVKKFIIEVRTVLLRHPNIVPIIDFGIRDEDDIAYLVMDYAPNGTLRQCHPKGTHLPLTTAVTYVNQVAAALQYAHNQRCIHRDVKPANLLFGVNSELLLSDFGISVVAHTDASQRTEDMSGSPAYMAPEQWQGKPLPASDQYALGIIVYEWLCGECPFQGDTPYALMNQHIQASPPPLHTKVPTIPPDVEQVVMKALEKDPQKRFSSVQAFAETFAKACTMPLAGTRLLTYRGHTETVSSVAWSPNGKYIASGGDDKTIQVWDALTGNKRLTYTGHTATVNSVTWSPDGKYIASTGDDVTVQVWDALTGNKRLTYTGHKVWWIYSVAWSPDGKYIASAGKDITTEIWDALTGNKRLTCIGQEWVYSVAWSPDGKYIASAGGDGSAVCIWDVFTGIVLGDSLIGKRRLTYTGHTADAVYSVAWSPNGKYIASGGDDKTIQVWDALTGNKRLTYTDHTATVNSVTWSPDGKYIASGSQNGTVQVWEAK